MAPLPAPAEKPSHRVSDSQSHAKVRPPTQVAVFCAALWPNLQPALTAIMDAWSRRIVGYALGRRIDAQLTLTALATAIEGRNPPAGCIHHSDRGSQYAAQAYRTLLIEHGLVGSMARRGNPTTTR